MSKLEQAANAAAQAMPGGRALDPATILTIADIISQLIERCQEKRAAELKQTAAKPSLIERLIVRRTTKSELTRQQWRSFGQDVMEGIFKAGGEADEADIEALKAEVQSL